MASPRVLGYDDLHDCLDELAESAQSVGDDYDEDGKPEMAARHWGMAEAYREVTRLIERELMEHRYG